MQKLTQEEVIARFKVVHGDKYDYSLVKYKGRKKEVDIICPIHGVFSQRADHHWDGCECPRCKINERKNIIYGFGVNDLDEKVINTKAYVVWRGILQRCYGSRDNNRYPTYQDCFVCEEWRNFSIFKKWFDENYIEGYQIDKDILVKGNKLYSPETCCFVPKEINILFSKNKRTELPVGVTRDERCPSIIFKAKYTRSIGGEKTAVWLGYYRTPEGAFSAYKTAKEAYIKEVAEDYYSRGAITKKVYDAMTKYRIEITD